MYSDLVGLKKCRKVEVGLDEVHLGGTSYGPLGKSVSF